MKPKNRSPQRTSRRSENRRQDDNRNHKSDKLRVQTEPQSECFKNVIFMRHGRIDFSYRKGYMYFFIHRFLNIIRRFIKKHSSLKKSAMYGVLAKSIKKIKKELRELSGTDTDYGNLNYRQFMRFLLHEIDPPLAKRGNGINVKKIPMEIDVIYHSSAKRSIQSAKYIQKRLTNRDKQPRIESCLTEELDEVKFSKNILSKTEFKQLGGLKGARATVLEKWYRGANQAETFQHSIDRIEKLCDFIGRTADRNILLITHGWYLRLLYLYFKNKEESLKNLKSKECNLGHGKSFQIRLRKNFLPHATFYNNNKNNDIRPKSPSDSNNATANSFR